MDIKFNKPIILDQNINIFALLKDNINIGITQISEHEFSIDLTNYKKCKVSRIRYSIHYNYVTICAYKSHNKGMRSWNFNVTLDQFLNLEYEKL